MSETNELDVAIQEADLTQGRRLNALVQALNLETRYDDGPRIDRVMFNGAVFDMFLATGIGAWRPAESAPRQRQRPPSAAQEDFDRLLVEEEEIERREQEDWPSTGEKRYYVPRPPGPAGVGGPPGPVGRSFDAPASVEDAAKLLAGWLADAKGGFDKDARVDLIGDTAIWLSENA